MSRLHTYEPPSMPSSLLLTLPHLAKESLGLCRPQPPVLYLCTLLITLTSSRGTLARWQSPSKTPQSSGRGRDSKHARLERKMSDRGSYCKERPKPDCCPQPGAESPFLWESSSQGECTKLKHGRANPVSGFACADGVAGFTSTALILIPLPTALPVWTLLRNCGHCLKRTAAELGSQGSV